MLLNNQMVYRYVWIRNQLSCQEPFSKPSSPSKGWRCSPSWDTKPTVSNSGMNFTRVCVVCQREQTVTNTRKSITTNHSASQILLQELSGSFYSSDWSGEISSFMRCFRRSIPGAVFAAIRIGKVESWMLLQTSSPEALHVSRAALGSSTLCKSKQNPQTSPVRAL